MHSTLSVLACLLACGLCNDALNGVGFVASSENEKGSDCGISGGDVPDLPGVTEGNLLPVRIAGIWLVI